MIENLRKYLAELLGTMFLVFFGCGTAVAATRYVTDQQLVAPQIFTWLLIALAFGLSLVAIIAMFGRISGAHVNPAVSIACLIDGRMNLIDCVCYIAAQIIGACAGSSILAFIWNSTEALGANVYETNSALGAMVTFKIAFAVELILTFAFVLTVLAATKKEKSASGLVIGLTLTLVHIFGIPFTGTSVNPARSIGPAIFTDGVALEQLPVFIIAPLLGGILAALLYRFILDPKEKTLAFADDVEDEMLDDEDEFEDEEEYEDEYEDESEDESLDEEESEEEKEEVEEEKTKKTTSKKSTKKQKK